MFGIANQMLAVIALIGRDHRDVQRRTRSLRAADDLADAVRARLDADGRLPDDQRSVRPT